MAASPTLHRPRWRLDAIAFESIDVSLVHDDEFLFVTLASASFVEILAEAYSANLIAHFQGNQAVTDWLANAWQHEEVQHGHAFKAYVQKVWPEFEWERHYQTFKAQYSLLCTTEQLEPQRALEMLARCVVETGTSTFYRALHDYVNEPVLQQLLTNIQLDEVSHYKHFRRYFDDYNAVERHGVIAVMRTIWRRMRDIQGEDAYIAFKNVSVGLHPGRVFDERDWHRYNHTVKQLARRFYPFGMGIRMLVKPIPMSDVLKRALQWPLVRLARLVSTA